MSNPNKIKVERRVRLYSDVLLDDLSISRLAMAAEGQYRYRTGEHGGTVERHPSEEPVASAFGGHVINISYVLELPAGLTLAQFMYCSPTLIYYVGPKAVEYAEVGAGLLGRLLRSSAELSMEDGVALTQTVDDETGYDGYFNGGLSGPRVQRIETDKGPVLKVGPHEDSVQIIETE